MAKSQGRRLKDTLRSKGLIGPISKDRKKNKKDDADIVKSIRNIFNPFDVKTTNQKHQVLGRKITGAVGKPGVSKQIGEEKRRRAFQLESSRKNKAGGIVDRRFGENDYNLTPEERMMERFTRERQQTTKSSRFNLDDPDEEGLTHYGQTLSLADDFDAGDLGVETESDEGTSPRTQRTVPYEPRESDNESESERSSVIKKSKSEVMKEVIAKSKFYKLERQAMKRADESVVDELNQQENIDELYDELNTITDVGNTQRSAEDQSYEQQVRELAFERRAKPADRTKTEEELLLEKEESRRLLEQDRYSRMAGSDENEDERFSDVSNHEENQMESGNESEANDMEEFGIHFNPDKSNRQMIEDDAIMSIISSSGSNKSSRITTQSKESNNDIVSCPQSSVELSLLFDQFKEKEKSEVVALVLSSFEQRKSSGNAEILSSFSCALAKYITTHVWTSSEADTLERLRVILRDLSKKFNEDISTFFRNELFSLEVRMHARMESRDKTVYPEYSDLLLLSLLGNVFSTSDRYHWTVTPAMLIMGQHLAQLSIRNLKDVFSGLFICSLIYSYQKLSKRYVPEVLYFLRRVLKAFSGKQSSNDLIECNLSIGKDLPWQVKAQPICLAEFNTEEDMSFKYRLFLKAVELVSIYSSLWIDISAYDESFHDIRELLALYANSHALIKQAVDKLERNMKFSKQSKLPLCLQSHKPLAIPTYAPKFEHNYSVDRKSYDPDRQRQELNKLKAEIKKERKGALRDIRKDASFLAREKIREKRQQDEDYHKTVARLERTIATEEGTEKNRYEREKKARKRKT